MPSSIQFLRDPRYTDTVVLFILSPAGVQYSLPELGRNLFGNGKWEDEVLIIDGLAPRAGFRYTDISLHWTDFLDLAFRHIDHALFYVPHKEVFKEIRKDSLLPQNPDLYSFSFYRFTCEARKGMVLPPPQVEPVLRRIIPAETPPPAEHANAGSTSAATTPPTRPIAQSAAPRRTNGRAGSDSETTLVDARLVSVDAAKLARLFDRLGALYADSIEDMHAIRALLEGRK